MGNQSGSLGVVQCSRDIDDIEILNQDAMPSDSSSEEGGSKSIKNKREAIRVVQERNEARFDDLIYVYQQFVTTKELKYMIKSMQLKQEGRFNKNEKRISAICKGTIPNLGVSGHVEDECPWNLYASKWK